MMFALRGKRMDHKRHKPSKQLLATTHEASELDYSKLAQAVIRACIARDKNIFYKLPYFAKVAEDFPKGILVKKDGLCDVYKAKTTKVCDWLHANGHLPSDHKNLMLQLRQMAYMEARINSLLKMDKISVDSEKALCDNVVSDLEDNKEEE